MSDLAPKLPPGSWDSHIHIFDEEHWHIADDAPFHPKQANLDHLLAFEKTLGIDHVCIIATSVYGLDNSCSIDALRRLKGRGRGIACINPDTITNGELDELHSVGFRGIRLNLRTRSETLSPEQWARELPRYANRIKRLDWTIQIFVSMPQIASVATIIPQLGVKIVIDHLGHPEPDSHKAVLEQPGCAELYKILSENKDAYVKLSGTYRLDGVVGVDEHIRKLLKMFPNQIVWGSDWPHTAGPEYNPGGDPKAVQEFLKPDMMGFLRKCWDLCEGNEGLVKKIWVDNPRRLWDYSGDD